MVRLPVYWNIYWPEHFLVLILSVHAFYWLLDTEHCSNQMASHLSCFLGFELFVLERELCRWVIRVNHAFSNSRHNKHIKSEDKVAPIVFRAMDCLNPCELQPPAGERESLQLCDIYYHCNQEPFRFFYLFFWELLQRPLTWESCYKQNSALCFWLNKYSTHTVLAGYNYVHFHFATSK